MVGEKAVHRWHLRDPIGLQRNKFRHTYQMHTEAIVTALVTPGVNSTRRQSLTAHKKPKTFERNMYKYFKKKEKMLRCISNCLLYPIRFFLLLAVIAERLFSDVLLRETLQNFLTYNPAVGRL